MPKTSFKQCIEKLQNVTEIWKAGWQLSPHSYTNVCKQLSILASKKQQLGICFGELCLHIELYLVIFSIQSLLMIENNNFFFIYATPYS